MRKKRGYTREIPTELIRDYKLFAIACEGGKREPEYFRLFEQIFNTKKLGNNVGANPCGCPF